LKPNIFSVRGRAEQSRKGEVLVKKGRERAEGMGKERRRKVAKIRGKHQPLSAKPGFPSISPTFASRGSIGAHILRPTRKKAKGTEKGGKKERIQQTPLTQDSVSPLATRGDPPVRMRRWNWACHRSDRLSQGGGKLLRPRQGWRKKGKRARRREGNLRNQPHPGDVPDRPIV